MLQATTAVPLDQPDPRVLHVVAILRALSLIVVAGIASFTLAASVFAPLGRALPGGWAQTTVAPAICAIFCAVSLALSRPTRSRRTILLGQGLAAVVFLIAGFEVVRHLTTSDAILRADQSILQAAFSYLFLGALLLCLQVQRPVLSYCVDALTTATCILVLVFFYRYTLGAMRFLEVPDVSHFTRTPGQVIACITLLTFVAFNQRAEYGIFAVLFDGGIAGKTARFAAPFALGLPILRSIGRGYIHTEYVTAITSFAAFSLLLLLCLRISSLEREVRNLSLRDELTGLYNRRGFNVLAEQAYRLACRSGEPFSVLFIDMDNLKQINDIRGHDIGSELLKEMAAILRHTFRETDVIGRLGGDEFVIAGKSDSVELAYAVQRLENSARQTNQSASRPYTLSFSLGHSTTDHAVAHSLDDMIQHADKVMYETKRLKKKIVPAHRSQILVASAEVSSTGTPSRMM